MAKKKAKKADAEKKVALQIKKEAKADKKAQKRLDKVSGGGGEENFDDDIDGDGTNKISSLDALLQQYKQHDQVLLTTIESLDGFPPPRSNASLTLYEDLKKKNAEVYMFGGEYFDGLENLVLDHLLKYDLQKQEWKRILTPVAPPARCAHSCVYYNHALYIFGGERCVADEYYHYKDCWKYDIRQQIWEEIKPNRMGTMPSARSGHSAVVWKHYMIVFGGFYEAMKDAPRWFHDVTVLDLQTLQWMDIPHSKLSMRPEPRSACNVAIVGDDKMIVHGGFSKLSKTNLKLAATADDGDPATTETKVHTDAWILHLKPLLQNKPPTWERVTSSIGRSQIDHAKNPCGRSGTGSVAYKDRLLVYGGVVDKEQYDFKMDSIFYNDLNAFDFVRRKWFPVNARQTGAGQDKRRRRKVAGEEAAVTKSEPSMNQLEEHESKESDDEEDSDLDEEEDGNVENRPIGWDEHKLRSSMFAFMDGNGNVIYEKIEENDDSVKEAREEPDAAGKEEKVEEEDEDAEESKGNDSDHELDQRKTPSRQQKGKSVGFRTLTASSIMIMNDETQMPEAIQQAEPLPRIKPAMFVAGSVLYVYGGLLEVGDREVTLDDFWSFDLRKREKWECIFAGTMHKQVWRGAVNDDEDSYYSADRNDNDEEGLGSDEDESDAEEKTNVNGDLKHDMQIDSPQANEASDDPCAPKAGESMAEFYSRTTDYWNNQATMACSTASSDPLSAKELKRQGFALARQRYEELMPDPAGMNDLKIDPKEAKRSSKKEKSRK